MSSRAGILASSSRSASLPVAAIAAAAVVLGGVLTAGATAYAAHRKTAELKILYEQRLADRYIANAREYLEGIYLPLSIALSTLRRSYEQLANEALGQSDKAAPGPELAAVVAAFIATVDGLMASGADAFMTTELDERLLDFVEFL